MTAARRQALVSPPPKPQLAWNNRILVVEDEPEIAKIYAEILGSSRNKVVALRSSRQATSTAAGPAAKSEFEVVVVHTAEDALAEVRSAWARGERFAMGFFDVLLGPGMDGIELVRDLHRIDPHLYAVFVTAYHDRGVDAIRALLGEGQASYWDYLNKPFSQGEILQKARNFVSLWNLQVEKAVRDELLADLHRRLLENERSASVAAVARGVSHEFGNILMQIMGKADLGRNKSEPEMRATLETILDASQRAAEILDRFKDLSGHSSGTRREWVDLQDLVREALDLLEHPLKTQKIKIVQVAMESARVFADSTALLQVLVNLCINAIHAMGSEGQIDLTLKNLGARVELRVRDHGPGIPAELIEKVLEPFFTTKGDQGTGLGLSICREIVEVDHGGEFTLQNHPNKGLEIVIQLPTQLPQEDVHDPS